MKQKLVVQAALIVIVVFCSCKKEKEAGGCYEGDLRTRTITNKQATVKVTATVSGLYIVEDGSIDTKLIPCNLPVEFVQNDLPVIISGDVKATVNPPGTPCCSENFVITSIRK